MAHWSAKYSCDVPFFIAFTNLTLHAGRVAHRRK
jgi:hypothetical protein